MLREMEFGDWAPWVAAAAFLVSFGVFLFFVIGAIRMSKKKVKHDSELPLEDENRS